MISVIGSSSMDLPYWNTHLIRHNLDVMHIEKNVFDNIFNTVMDINGKTKDNLNARKDLKNICNRPKLEVDERRPNAMPKAACSVLIAVDLRNCWVCVVFDWPECSDFDLCCNFNLVAVGSGNYPDIGGCWRELDIAGGSFCCWDYVSSHRCWVPSDLGLERAGVAPVLGLSLHGCAVDGVLGLESFCCWNFAIVRAASSPAVEVAWFAVAGVLAFSHYCLVGLLTRR
ncbi:UNVERIFIED_CONTAM: hypothetical protein Slati_0122500 [Sesamum latifolium]|uniref:Uncharacterized protein n=1 Tax=Sesamum latifolium TaxID=2727402 RepID=A0AAW2Y988_9LAMI